MSENSNVLDESGTDGAECSRRVAGAIRSLVKLGICSLSILDSCIKHWLYQFLRMAEAMLCCTDEQPQGST